MSPDAVAIDVAEPGDRFAPPVASAEGAAEAALCLADLLVAVDRPVARDERRAVLRRCGTEEREDEGRDSGDRAAADGGWMSRQRRIRHGIYSTRSIAARCRQVGHEALGPCFGGLWGGCASVLRNLAHAQWS